MEHHLLAAHVLIFKQLSAKQKDHDKIFALVQILMSIVTLREGYWFFLFSFPQNERKIY